MPNHGETSLIEGIPMFYDELTDQWLPILVNSKGEVWIEKSGTLDNGKRWAVRQELKDIEVPQPDPLYLRMKGE